MSEDATNPTEAAKPSEATQPAEAQKQTHTVLSLLLKRYPTAKRTTFKRMLENGRLRVAGKPATSLKQPVGPRESLTVSDHAPGTKSTEPRLPFKVVFEDEDLLVIDKPAGILTSTVPGERRTTALRLVEDYVGLRDPDAKVGLIHRLDKDASGLLVFSKNAIAYDSLKQQFFDHSAGRSYLAVVRGRPKPPAGKIESRLVEKADQTVRSTDLPKVGQEAITHYKTIRAVDDETSKRTLLTVKLETGRKHQIRVHLAEKGWPIVNDPIYSQSPVEGRLMLCAILLELKHPRTGEQKSFSIKPPREFGRPDAENPR